MAVMTGATRTAIFFRVTQRNLFRHKLADYQGKVSNDGNDETNADRLGNADGQAQVDEPFGQTQPKRGSRKGAGKDTDQGNTDLNGRQKSTWISCEGKRAARANDVAIDQGP